MLALVPAHVRPLCPRYRMPLGLRGDCRPAPSQCDMNPGFMIGTREAAGQCAASCDRCDVMVGTSAQQQLGAAEQQHPGNSGGGSEVAS